MANKEFVTSRVNPLTFAATASTAMGDESHHHPAKPFAARSLMLTVDFGDDMATEALVSVTSHPGLGWIAVDDGLKARPICQVTGRPGVAGVDDEDALLDQVSARIVNIVDGVSFDVLAHAPEGTTGLYTVQILGV